MGRVLNFVSQALTKFTSSQNKWMFAMHHSEKIDVRSVVALTDLLIVNGFVRCEIRARHCRTIRRDCLPKNAARRVWARGRNRVDLKRCVSIVVPAARLNPSIAQPMAAQTNRSSHGSPKSARQLLCKAQ